MFYFHFLGTVSSITNWNKIMNVPTDWNIYELETHLYLFFKFWKTKIVSRYWYYSLI